MRHPGVVACYFSLCVRDESKDVRICFDAAFMIAWAHSIATALTTEIENHRRVSTCSGECIACLARFKSLDDCYVYCVRIFLSIISFRSLLCQLRRIRLLLSSSLFSRLDYLSGATVTWSVLSAVEVSIVLPPTHTDLRETRTPIPISSPVTSLSVRSPLEVLFPDEQLRTEPL